MFIGERQDRTFYVYGKSAELHVARMWLNTLDYVTATRGNKGALLQVFINQTVPYYCLDSVYDELVTGIQQHIENTGNVWASSIDTLNMEGL